MLCTSVGGWGFCLAAVFFTSGESAPKDVVALVRLVASRVFRAEQALADPFGAHSALLG